MTPASTCLIVSYHYVHDSGAAGLPKLHSLGVRDFGAQLDLLGSAATLLDYQQFSDLADGRFHPQGQSALLTFDDGLLDHRANVLPALRARGLHGIFFVSPPGDLSHVLNVQKVQLLLAALGGTQLAHEVEGLASHLGLSLDAPVPAVLYRYDDETSRHVKRLLNYQLPYEVADDVLRTLFARHIGDERELAPRLYMGEAMIRELSAAGMTIGFHTRRHRILSRLDAAQQRQEIAGGVEWIRGLTGQNTVPFCYPHGHAQSYNADTLAVVGDCGYAMAFTAVRAMARPATDPRLELPRYDTCDVEAVLNLQR